MMHRINGHKIPLFFDLNHKAWYIVFCIGDKPVENFSNYISWYNENDLPKFKEYIQQLDDRRDFWCDHWKESKLDGHDVDGFVAALKTHELEELERSIQPILGAKGNICPAFKKLTRAQLHAMHGHISYLEGCVICEAIRKTTRRVSSETDAFKEHQSGATWSIDLVTHIKVPAIDGAKYFRQATGLIAHKWA
jgi:hypothetical protein